MSGCDARGVGLASIAIVASMPAWMALMALGGAFGRPSRFAMLFDFAVIAAFLCSMIVVFQVWRKRRSDGGAG